MGDTLTAREAYAAMFTFLEEIYQRTESDDLGALLGGMSLLQDEGTADPAAWSDWETAEVLKRCQAFLAVGLASHGGPRRWHHLGLQPSV